MADETLAFVEEAALPYLHVFPYSERPGTPAARMPPVPAPVRRARAAALRAEGDRQAARFHAGLVGRTATVLAERGKARPHRTFRAGPYRCTRRVARHRPAVTHRERPALAEAA